MCTEFIWLIITGSFGHSSEIYELINGRKLLDQLSNSQFLKKNTVSECVSLVFVLIVFYFIVVRLHVIQAVHTLLYK
jgi:hypothetical protein